MYNVITKLRKDFVGVSMKILKKSELANGSKLELVEIGLDKFEILLNGEVQAVEYDISRAEETFDNLVHYYN